MQKKCCLIRSIIIEGIILWKLFLWWWIMCTSFWALFYCLLWCYCRLMSNSLCHWQERLLSVFLSFCLPGQSVIDTSTVQHQLGPFIIFTDSVIFYPQSSIIPAYGDAHRFLFSDWVRSWPALCPSCRPSASRTTTLRVRLLTAWTRLITWLLLSLWNVGITMRTKIK